jgi:hypothetical protein
MKLTDTPERTASSSNEMYIEFLRKNLGASREEILDVTRRSGISARRIAEYLLRQQAGIYSESHVPMEA